MTSTLRSPDSRPALHEQCHGRLPAALERRVAAAAHDWRLRGNTSRLWARDASLWTDTNESKWLDWLNSPHDQLKRVELLQQFASQIQEEAFRHILVLGMGGSVLCAEVLATAFGTVPGYPRLLVLDSTDANQIRRFVSEIDLTTTLFIISSKSGTTLETDLLRQYFYHETKKRVGPDLVGPAFVAITDPGSPLVRLAKADHFRHVFLGEEGVGGRFSALSTFGLVPAAAMGLDIRDFLNRTLAMVESCGPDALLEENPGIMLGLILAVAASDGHDKVTLVTSPGLWDLGVWIEQLLAESTGKAGKGILPIVQEDLAAPSAYRNDRLFCYIRERRGADPVQDVKMDLLAEAGHPLVQIDIVDKQDLGQEFFRWEIAVATAGAVLGINPFDQPDVEASKHLTRQLIGEYELKRALPEEAPLTEDDSLKVFADSDNAEDLTRLTGGVESISALLQAHLQRLRFGDYFALLAFIDMNPEFTALLQATRHRVRDIRNVATLLEFGPRYLHSTGQIFKGGPNSGLFLLVTCDDSVDLPVPGRTYTFGVVKAAQARADHTVLAERGRRVLWVHLDGNVRQGLARLHEMILHA